MTQNTQPTSIKTLMADLEVGRSTLYRHIKNLNITPHKIKGAAHLTAAETAQVIQSIKGNAADETSGTSPETDGTNETDDTNNPDYLRGQIDQLKEKLAESENEKRQLTLLVGEWKGRVTTLEEQNRLLLPQAQKPSFWRRLFLPKDPPHWKNTDNQDDETKVIELDPQDSKS